MSSFKSFWRSTPKTLVALLMGVTTLSPMMIPTTTNAQRLPGSLSNPASRQTVIPQGTRLSVRYDEAQKILVTSEETMPLILTLSANIRNRQGEILIPAGSEIVGEIRPAGNGSQFVAQSLIVNQGSREYSLNATSDIVTRTETIDQGADTGNILKGAAAGAAAATLISAITGDNAIATEEVLGGAGVGALAGWLLGKNRADLISINPNQDLTLTLQSNLTLGQSNQSRW